MTAKIGEEILPFEMGYLPEYFVKKAEVELHDTPERRAQCIRQLSEAAKNDKNMKIFEFDDLVLVQYLRAHKFNVSRAFLSMKAYIKLRRRNPKMFIDFRFEVTIKAMTDKMVTVLPYRCQDGCAIILIQLDNWIPEEFPVEEVKKLFVILLVQSLSYPMTQVNGIKAIIDVKSNPVRHLKHATPNNMYLIYHGIQECFPARYKAVHVINESITFQAAWLIVKPFVSQKIKKRIHFHSSCETLLDFFPRSVLPEKYGGDLKDYDMSGWLHKMMQPEALARVGGIKNYPRN